MFFHLGLTKPQPVRIHELSPQGSRPIPYRTELFDFGQSDVKATWGDIGFAGFRIHHPLNSQAYKDEVIVFLGASYFRALGAGQ